MLKVLRTVCHGVLKLYHGLDIVKAWGVSQVFWQSPTHGIISTHYGKLFSMPIITCIHVLLIYLQKKNEKHALISEHHEGLFFCVPSESISEWIVKKLQFNLHKNFIKQWRNNLHKLCI